MEILLRELKPLVPDIYKMTSDEKASIKAASALGEAYFPPERELAPGVREIAHRVLVSESAREVRERRALGAAADMGMRQVQPELQAQAHDVSKEEIAEHERARERAAELENLV